MGTAGLRLEPHQRWRATTLMAEVDLARAHDIESLSPSRQCRDHEPVSSRGQLSRRCITANSIAPVSGQLAHSEKIVTSFARVAATCLRAS